MVYFPFRYTGYVKYGTEHILSQNFLSDLPVLLLSITIVNDADTFSIVGMVLMYVAFMAIYELGYHENDSHEKDNKIRPAVSSDISKTRESYRHCRMTPSAWIWAIALSVVGSLLFAIHTTTIANNPELTITLWGRILLTWTSFLILVRAIFWFYNTQASLFSRQLLYPILQVGKTFGFVLLMPTNVVGSVFMASHVFKRWINYLIYRHDGDNRSFSGHRVGLLTFLLLLGAIMIGIETLEPLLTQQFWLIIVWSLIRGLPEFFPDIPYIGKNNRCIFNKNVK